MSDPCNKVQIIHKYYSQERNQRRELYFQACSTFSPLQVWTTRPSIHLTRSPMHHPLVAEIPSAISNREIIPIRRKLSSVQRLSAQGLISTRLCLDHVCLQKEIKETKTFVLDTNLPALQILILASLFQLSMCSNQIHTDVTRWCPIFHPFHVCISVLLSQGCIAGDTTGLCSVPIPCMHNVQVWGALLCHEVKFTNGLQELVDRLFYILPFLHRNGSEMQFIK